MQLETDALIRGERSGSDPGRETISGERLHGDVMTNAGEINIGVPVKDQTQGAVAGVFLLSVEARLDARGCLGNEPGKSTIFDIGFESAVPQNRVRGTLQISQARKKDCLVPDAGGIRYAFSRHQGADEGEGIVQGNAGMQEDEPVPCLEGIFGVSFFRLLPNYIEGSIADGR